MNRTSFSASILACLVAAAVAAAEPVALKIQPKAQPFPLRQVQLLDGPFKNAELQNHKYLLSLDVDQLLHTFRLNAKLPSTVKSLGGWEAPGCELRGHFIGHYLTACALTYAATGDVKIKEKGDQVVAGLAQCQAAMKNGYLSAYPESFIERVEACKPVWAPYYTLHKIYAGLIDMHTLAGNQQALEVMKKAAEWIQGRTEKLSDAQMEKMLGNEHGGMNDVLAELAAVTGDPKYLALSRRFNHHAVLDPLARREDRLTGLHANTQFPKILGAGRQYELTGDPAMRTIAEFFWNTVTNGRSYVIGGNSDGEHFSPKEHMSRAFGPSTTETCNTYNMRKITRRIFCWEPKAEYADYDERALYNHILASQHPETGMVCYYVPLRPGMERTYGTTHDSFWCCTGTGIESHAKYGDSIYFHDGGRGLWVNLYIASELDWSQKGVKIRQETSYPESDKTRLTFTCTQPTELDIRVRHPFWAASGIQVSVNGQRQAMDSKPGSYVSIERTWKTGDTLEVVLPMSLRTEAFADNPRKPAILYGPVVLCGEVKKPSDLPFIVSDEMKFLESVKPVAGKPLTFTGAAGVFRTLRDKTEPTSLVAFYKKVTGPYVVYWDVLAQAEAAKKVKLIEVDAAREKGLAARTIDAVKIGDGESERAHKLRGERQAAGEFGGFPWRHATDGWFSYELKVLPDAPAVLLCRYWGGDSGRVFDILIDGQKIATQHADGAGQGYFYDKEYAVAESLTKGKSHVTVRFQAHKGSLAGGVFDVRMLKKE